MKLNQVLIIVSLGILLVSSVHFAEGKGNKRRNNDNDEKYVSEPESASEDKRIYESLTDSVGSAQGVNPTAVNPYATQILLQNQALLNNQGLLGYGGTTSGNSALAAAALGAGQGLNGNSFVNAAVGGLSPYQNPLLFGGGSIPGIASPDIYTQSAAQAQLYNNPYLGAAAFGGAGISSGINPLLLRGATNLQYPIIAGNNPYLNAQALLSPYSSYNQLNPYNNFPFASRFGIGVGRSSVGSRQNQNNNNDE